MIIIIRKSYYSNIEKLIQQETNECVISLKKEENKLKEDMLKKNLLNSGEYPYNLGLILDKTINEYIEQLINNIKDKLFNLNANLKAKEWKQLGEDITKKTEGIINNFCNNYSSLIETNIDLLLVTNNLKGTAKTKIVSDLSDIKDYVVRREATKANRISLVAILISIVALIVSIIK